MDRLLTLTLVILAAVAAANGRVTAEFYSRMRELLRQRAGNKGSTPIPIEVRGWPPVALPSTVGQVAGISVDLQNRPVIFHRGPVIWDQGSFNGHNEYLRVDEGPIREETVLTLDPESGAVVNAWGAGHFFMPHGITVDDSGQVWLTDVAMHQVFRFPPGGADVATLTLGRRFEPGRDSAHFCQPTSVAVAPGGDVFVGDGYCNARVVHLTPSGRFVREIKARDEGIWPGFNVVHSLAILPGPELLCVADRDNRRVACAPVDLGHSQQHQSPWHRYHVEWRLPHFRPRTSAVSGATTSVGGRAPHHQEDPLHPVIEIMAPGGGRVFALCAAADNDTLYAVTGPSEPTLLQPHPISPTGIVIRPSATYIDTYWGPSSQESFTAPHAIAMSRDGESLYVSEIGPDRVWKFSLGHHNDSSSSAAEHQQQGQPEQAEALEPQQHPRTAGSS